MEKNINEYIDHTILKRDVLTKEIDQAVSDAIKYKFKGLCIAPFWISHVKEKLHQNNILVVTVIGFPYGQQSMKVKGCEAKRAMKDGADELDFIINASKVHEKDQEYLKKELAFLRKVTKGKTIKLIIETGLLNQEEKIFATKLGVEAGFDFIKTSTAVNTTGATVEDVKLMKEVINGRAKIKASGGVRTLKQAQELIKSGADRIGTSNGIDIVKGLEGRNEY
ncbi:MAG: deoxyribose-phosphate aldolase [Candidatus Hepatoplasma scabrum]|nr:MAG: deoxyribose-phosphate aldolase [Candidatus Hepatoplasma sp.]